MAELTIAIIAKNEEAMIGDCLESVKEADEIIVCDTGSTDKTIEIAKRYTDKVFTDYKWNDDFAEARNHALSKCKGGWVLSIDCDEILEKGGITKIRKLIKEATAQKMFSIRMNDNGNVHILPKLFRNDGSVKWVGAGHEVLTPTEKNLTDITIDYGYSPTHKTDPDRMLRILKKEVEKNPTPREMFYLAREYFYKKDYITSVWWYNEYLKKATWKPEIAEAYLMISKCYWYLNKGDDARMLCMNAIRINPDFKEALTFMAEIHYEPMKSQWLRYAGLAENTDVLFTRNVKIVSHTTGNIPKIIHQIWVGDKPRPGKWMNTWKEKHLNWEYKIWDEEAIRKLPLKNEKVFNKCKSLGLYHGMADIARTEILEKYGGVYIDADSVCKESLDDAPFMKWDLFSVYEADNFFVDGIRMVANGIIGAIPNHPLITKYREEQGKVEEPDPVWRQIGSLLWSKIVKGNNNLLEPYTFLPIHHSGFKNHIGGKVYAEQFWGTSQELKGNDIYANPRQIVDLNKIDIWSGPAHTQTQDGFIVNPIDGKSTEEHIEGIKFFKKLIKKGIPIFPPLVKKTKDGYIKLDGFKRLMAYKELGIKTVEVFVIYEGQEIDYNGKKMTCRDGGQSYYIFKNAVDFQKIADDVPERFYGHRVYQSIYYKGEKIIQGGRDLLARFNLIDLKDIKDKTIIDIGCNLGASCIWAIENGAKKAFGFDKANGVIKAAKQIAEGLRVDCEYEIVDFGQDQPKKGDTLFCFAIDKYIDNKVLADNLVKYNVVYFETHLGTNIPKQIAEKFKVELRGEITEGDYKRKIYRLWR